MGKRLPAMTPEERENQLIADAYALAEEKIKNGTASSQLITHFLKMGSRKDRIERELMEQNKLLAEAKINSLNAAQELKERYEKAIEAMMRYSGREDEDDEML